MSKFIPKMNSIMVAALVALSFSSIKAEIIAYDDFESYTVGTRNLIGQPTGGFGFAGNWFRAQNYDAVRGVSLDAYDDGTIGSNGTLYESNASSFAAFSSSTPVASRVFMKYDFIINGDNGIGDATRMDLLSAGGEVSSGGSRVFLGVWGNEFLIGVNDNFGSGDSGFGIGNTTGALSGVSTNGLSGKQVLIGMLDTQFNQMAIWVNPDSRDFYDSATGQSSADGVSAWNYIEADLPELAGVGAVRNRDTKIAFDNFALATEFSDELIAPTKLTGTITTGNQTWINGQSYAWKINDSDGTAGGSAGWDLIDITATEIEDGTLDLSNLTTGGFGIDIISLDALNDLGLAEGFDDPNGEYEFVILTTVGGITGFDAENFAINDADFQNSGTWEWSIAQDGNNLVLSATGYTLVPEPSSTALLALGGLAVMMRRRRS